MIEREPTQGVSRRRLLGGTAAVGGATLLGAFAAPNAAAAPQVPQPGSPTQGTSAAGLTFFPPNGDQTYSDLNFEVSFVFGEAAYGAGEVGEAATAVDTINAGGVSYQSFFDTFMALGLRLARKADDAEAAGNLLTARARRLRSTAYYNQALFFVLGTSTPSAEESVYRTMQEQWAAYTDLADGYERVLIPYRDGISMPAYFIGPGDGVPRKTVIITNGSDAQFVDVYAYGAAAAAERGYNALIFEGPGQGSLLFEQRLPFTPDWAGVITPIVDYLLGRGDVDPTRIALTGWSMGGNLVIRAAATEHRLAAVVSDPGALSLIASYQQGEGNEIFGADVPPTQAQEYWQGYITSPGFTAEQKFLFAKRSEIYSSALLADARAGVTFQEVGPFIEILNSYTLRPAAVANVTAHVLVIDYELDEFFPGQPEEMITQLTNAASKELHTFTTAEGAEFHCAPLAPRVRNEVVFDWLDSVLDGNLPPPPPTTAITTTDPSTVTTTAATVTTAASTAAVATTAFTTKTGRPELSNTGATENTTGMALTGLGLIGAGAATLIAARRQPGNRAG